LGPLLRHLLQTPIPPWDDRLGMWERPAPLPHFPPRLVERLAGLRRLARPPDRWRIITDPRPPLPGGPPARTAGGGLGVPAVGAARQGLLRRRTGQRPRECPWWAHGTTRSHGPVSVGTVCCPLPGRACCSAVAWRTGGAEPRCAVSAASSPRSPTRVVSRFSNPCSPRMSGGSVEALSQASHRASCCALTLVISSSSCLSSLRITSYTRNCTPSSGTISVQIS
jgi:hypothetical protein